MSYFYIYKMTHPETKEFYIGRRTSKIPADLDYQYRGSSLKWYRTLSNDVIDNVLIKEIIKDDIKSDEELNTLEIYYISINLTNPLCMNAHVPGKGFHTIGPLSDEHKTKIGEFNKGRRWITNGIESKTISNIESETIPEGWYFGRIKFSESHIKKLSDSHKGVKLSDDHIKKISESLKGIPCSDNAKDGLSKALKGKKLSEEHKEKLSKSSKGRNFTDEHKKNISESKKGKPKNKKNENFDL